MALGMVMLGVVGSYLYQQIAAGLVEERRQVAMAEAVQLTKKVKVAFDRTDKAQDQESLWLFARDIVQDAAGTERSRYVILLRLVGNTATTNIPPVVSGEVRYTEVPDALQEAVARDASNQHVQIVSVKLTGTPDPVSSIIVGQQVTLPMVLFGAPYGYLGPSEDEDNDQSVDATGPLLLNRDYFGFPNDERDWYDFNLATTTTLFITLDNISGKDPQLTLYHEADFLVADTTAPYSLIHTTGPGHYYVRVLVAGNFNSTTQYKLRISTP